MRRALRSAAGIAAFTLATAGLAAAAIADPTAAPSPTASPAAEDVASGVPAASTRGDGVEADPSEHDGIAWSTCEVEEFAAAGVECGSLSVPLDRGDPEGRQISVAVSRHAATAPEASRRGPLLVNFGGPGGTGLDAPLFFSQVLPADLVASYDLIGFDPRGLGESRPLLSCGGADPFASPGPDPRFSASLAGLPGLNERAWIERWDEAVASCADASGDLLPHMTSTDVVADMDAIRAALGAEKINYYGFSYGTYLGQLYTTTYPERSRRVILDGNIDPRTWGYEDIFITARGMDEAAQDFFGWLADHDDRFDLGTDAADVEKAFYAFEQKLRLSPLGPIGPAEWEGLVSFATYSQDMWPFLGPVIATAAQGDTALLEELYAPTEGTTPEEDAAEAEAADSSLAVYLAALCGDSTWPNGYARWRADAVASAALAPIGTSNWFFGELGCRVWPAQKPLAAADGTQAPPLLLTTTATDPATPLLNSLNVRLQYPRSALLLDTGTVGHTATLAGNDCIDEQVFGYLRTGTLPVRNNLLTADTACSGRPLPDPSIADQASAEGGGARASVALLRRLMGRDGPVRPNDMMTPGAQLTAEQTRVAVLRALHARIIATQWRGRW